MALPLLADEQAVFPHPSTALLDPDGLLAVGGNLQPATLLSAYRQGIFPWYEQGQPILWWSPATRAVLKPGAEHCGRTLTRVIRANPFTLTTNRAFNQVIEACAAPRRGAEGTWITPAMIAAYQQLHRDGHAHSIECWQDGELAGGLYGLQLGGIFCGESMFSHAANASKIAFVALSRTLARQGFSLIDCQVANPHLTSLGATPLPRHQFLALLQQHRDAPLGWPQSDSLTASLALPRS